MIAQSLARAMFAMPGAAPSNTRHLLAQAAGSHAHLLDKAADQGQRGLGRMNRVLARYLRGPASAAEKRWLLDDPQLIEALHGLAPESATLADWDATVAPGSYQAAEGGKLAAAHGRLGNIVAAVLLRANRDWCGQIELATDAYGRVHFPFCDWTLVLVNTQDAGNLAEHRPLVLELDEHTARWTLSGTSELLLELERPAFLALFVDNVEEADGRGIRHGSGSWRTRLERAAPLGETPIRFEPIGPAAPNDHAEVTGGIITRLLEAIALNAPLIHNQLCQCIRKVHGFELPRCAGGHIASFSVPSAPGLIGFNVEYTEDDYPRLDPYAFMCLGHELGHTLHYLIDDVAYAHGVRFLENPGEWTPVIPRYGRGLLVRTLFQIPYAHLFEWWLLMRFRECGFRGLAWRMFDDWHEVGQDLRAEIEESFDLLAEHAKLTADGDVAVRCLRQLAAEAQAHWQLQT